MYRLSKKQKIEKPIHDLLNNGYKFVIVGSNGKLLKPGRIKLELQRFLICYHGAEVVELKSLLS